MKREGTIEMKSVRIVANGIVVEPNGSVELKQWAKEVIRFLNTTSYYAVKCRFAGLSFMAYRDDTVGKLVERFQQALTRAEDVFPPRR